MPTPLLAGGLSEEAHRQAEALSRSLFSNQFLLAFDAQQQCGYASPHCARLLGYAPELLTVDLLRQATHPDDRPLVLRAAGLVAEFAGYLGGELPAAHCASIDYRLRCHSGAYVRVLRQDFGLAAPADGAPLATASVFTDITGHKTSSDVRFSIDHPAFAPWIRTRKGTRTHDTLSLREQEILGRILAGGTNAALCNELFISELTLKTHRRNIHRKIKFATTAS